MFGKKRKRALFHEVDDSKSVVYDFRLRSSVTGFESYRTVEYRLYHKLEESEMLPLLDEHLTKLFAGEVDDGNGDMLDSILFGAVREAVPDLEHQHHDHIDMIRRLTIRRIADRDDIRRIRDERRDEMNRIQSDYENICHALENCEEEI